MANQMYGYPPPSYGGGNGYYPSRAPTDPYLSDPSMMNHSTRYPTSDPLSAPPDPSSQYASSFMNRGQPSSMYYNAPNDGYRYPVSDMGGVGGVGGYSGGMSHVAPTNSQPSWPGAVDVGGTFDPVGAKRSNEALYHQTVLDAQNTFGQSEALFTMNTIPKRPRYESATSLPIYPQRPGEKDCAHYMQTRACRYGENCKFDHPVWVPEGGIPDWKEAPQVTIAEALPERPGEPDCPYFLKTQKCKFGSRCKFNHPKNTTDSTSAYETVDVSVLPERPSEPPCTFYVKTGKCKFGVTCKFNHPKDIQIPSSGPENGNGEQTDSALKDNGTATGDVVDVQPFHPFAPALLHNSKGLPIRPGEVDCPFYIRTGSCKYGATCRYNHPDRYAINPPVAATLGHPIMNSPAASMNMGVMNPAAAVLPAIDPRLAQTSLGLGSTIYPQRPGQMECDFYMKTGECKFGERCKFHHPFDRSAPAPSIATPAIQQSVKLTLAGLPRREGAIICAYYMKTGACKYGIQCRFDHPPPGEAIAMATTLGISTASGGEVGGDKGAKTNDEEE